MSIDPLGVEQCPVCREPLALHQEPCHDSAWHAERLRQQAALEKLQAEYADLLARQTEGGA